MSTEAVHLPRHEARRRALEVLYEADVRRRDIADTLQRTISDPHAEPLDDFARGLVEGVAKGCEEIDGLIASHAHGWSVSRMPIIDRNILRLGVYELLDATDTPPAVVIDEAVELAKEMSTEDSPRYINGVLSAVLRSSRREGG
ncbi:MAG: transcription antitermination factor NusB [Actinomycetota bacterium]|nr:transcription antitermination factor NusB [Actinomycetota bacterium]